jgi:hypothetical protein
MVLKARLQGLIVWAIIAAIAGAIARFGFGVSFWVVAGLTVLALIVNGWIIEWEDRQPGGWGSDT